LPGESLKSNEIKVSANDKAPIVNLRVIDGNLKINTADGKTHDLGQIQGEDGADGGIGSTGPPGGKGYTGKPGQDGIKGEIGKEGERGLQGNVGLSGAKGEPGDTGLTGEQGGPGKVGLQGLKGDKGLKGDPGQRGISGATVIGPTGRDGVRGDPGPKGQAVNGIDGVIPDHEIDSPGSRFRFRKPDGEWGQWIKIPRGGGNAQDWTNSKQNFMTRGWIEIGPSAPGSIGNFRLIVTGGFLEIQKSTAPKWASHTYHGRFGL
jgi:hypothetical protein